MLVVQTRALYTNAPLGAVDWSRYEPPFFNSWAWNHRRAIVLGAIGAIAGITAAAVGSILK